MMFVVRCYDLLAAVSYCCVSLFVARCLLFVVCRLSAVCCLPIDVCCSLLLAVCRRRLLFVGGCLICQDC